MSCLLRIWGENFDSHAAAAICAMPVQKIWRAHEKRFPDSATNMSAYSNSGISVLISDADFCDLPRQIEQTIQFLKAHKQWLLQLFNQPNREGAIVDFGVEISAPFWASFEFPPTLLDLLAHYKIALNVSTYPKDNVDNDC